MRWRCDGDTDCMDLSDESSCDGVTHTCDPAVKFSCRDSGEDALSWLKWPGSTVMNLVGDVSLRWNAGLSEYRLGFIPVIQSYMLSSDANHKQGHYCIMKVQIFEQHKLKVDHLCSGQLAASARPGCVMVTVTVRTTLMRTTARRWCASCLITCVPPMTPSVFLLKSCVMALTTVRMALTRNFAVKYSSRSKTFWHNYVVTASLSVKNTKSYCVSSI